MARRTFEVIDVVEILLHWHAGRPKAVVASSVGVDPKTIRKYVAPAEAAGLVPGGPPLSRAEWTVLVRGWFPELVDARARSLTFRSIDVHREQIKEMLATNTTATVHQRLRDESGMSVSVTSFRRYVWLEFPDLEDAAAKVTVPRPEVPAGEEAQIDYGLLGSWQNPVGGRVRRVWAFVMVLACSRHMFVRPVISMDQRSWVAAHVAGLAFFGGTPRRLVSDNLKTGVTKADLYDPKLNRAYAEMAEHYGCLIDPARALKPKDKPRVERMMPYVRDSMWRGRTYTSEQQMQDDALRWCVDVAGRRQHRSLCGASPLAVFEAVEAPALIGLPVAPFELASWSTGKVAPDCYVKVGRALYTVPWKHQGTQVDARSGDRVVEVFVAGQLVKTHPRIESGRQTDDNDFPPDKIAFFQRTPVWCRRRAVELGVNVAAVVEDMLAVNTMARLRSAQGIIGLAVKHTDQRLDAACARAVTVGDPSYRTIKGILVAGTEHDGAPTVTTPTAPAHLHGPATLFNPDDDATSGGTGVGA